ncbi:MAG: LytR C-terminal domain-containing protein, partial [Solirubrobacteraceae bacterium]
SVAAPPAAAAAAAVAARAAASRTGPGEQSTGGGVATIPAAPAGVGAPALSSATRLIPLAGPDEISIRALKPSNHGGSGGEGTTNGTTVSPAPPPSTAAGAGNGVARPPVPVPMPTMAASAAQMTPPPRGAPSRQGRSPVAPPPHGRTGRERTGRRLRPVIFVLAGILAVAAVAVALVLFTGSTDSGTSSTGSPAAAASGATPGTTGKAGRRRRAKVVTPSAVTVAVLNGTTTNNLAHDVLAKLTAAGYHGGPNPQDASETALTSTIVGYTAPADRPDALAVAKSLNLGSASVQQISQGDRSKVCGSATSCPAQVVVTAGADLAPNG